MRKLTKQYIAALIVADSRGEIRPATKEMLDACVALAAHEYLSEHDNAPGTYRITAAGEHRLARALALKAA